MTSRLLYQNKRINRYLYQLSCILPGICTVLILFCSSCSKQKQETVQASGAKRDFSKSIANNVRFIISQQARTKAEILSPLFVRNDIANPPYIEMPKGVKANFFDDSAQIESILTAKYARYFINEQNILVQDSVVVTNKEGHQLRTEELIWNSKLEKFFSEKDVYIYREDYVAYGRGLEANKDFSVFTLTEQKGVIAVPKGTFPGN